MKHLLVYTIPVDFIYEGFHIPRHYILTHNITLTYLAVILKSSSLLNSSKYLMCLVFLASLIPLNL